MHFVPESETRNQSQALESMVSQVYCLPESSNQLGSDNPRSLDTQCRSGSVQNMHQESVLDNPNSVTVLRVNVGVEASVLAACLPTFQSSHTTVPQLKI